MLLSDLIAAKETEAAEIKKRYDQALARQRGIFNTVRDEGRTEPTKIELAEIEQLRGEAATAEKQFEVVSKSLLDLQRAGADEEKHERDAENVEETDAARRDQRDQATRPVTEQRGYDRQARIGSEPRTYSKESARTGTSFFVDAYRSQFKQDFRASERLQRHDSEIRVEREVQQMRATSTSSYAGLIPPQYLVQQAALIARAGRPTANVVQRLPLPATGMSLVIPKGTTGASAAIQSAENVTVSSTDQVWGNVTVPVVTIAGMQDMSRQSLERGEIGIDQLIYNDLSAAYAVALDTQVLNGSGSAGQMLGILQTAGINQATAFTAAATPATFYSKVGGQINAVETTRFMAPTVTLMAPRRWNWLVTQLDSSNRPLVVPNPNGPFNALGVYDEHVDPPSAVPAGSILGLPVITDANIPTSVGTGPEDQVIVARKEDLLLWEEGDGMPRELQFEQPLGNSLGIRLVAYGYAAFTAGRFPTAVGVVGGNAASGFGLVAPTF